MAFYEFDFPSANGKDRIKAWKYTPLGEPRGVCQLIHGYGEHSRRYLHLILALTDAGYVVLADDHLGHGATGLSSAGGLGNPDAKGPDTYVQDEISLCELGRKEYPNLPYFVLGHSWGSMLAREVAFAKGEDLSGVVLLGVVEKTPGMIAILENPDYLADLADHPSGYNNGWFDRCFGKALDRLGEDFPRDFWMAVDERITVDHGQDPFNCQETSMQLLDDFLKGAKGLADGRVTRETRAGLPFLLLGGGDDPCSNLGEGIVSLAEDLQESGKPCSYKIFAGYRHEVHSEPDIREEVFEIILKFLEENR